MKYLFFLVALSCSCSNQDVNAQIRNPLKLYDYSANAKLVGKNHLQDTYIYLFKDSEMSYKVISDKEREFIVGNIYKIDLLLLKRPDNMIPNLSIRHCVYNKRDEICTDVDYVQLYKFASEFNIINDH